MNPIRQINVHTISEQNQPHSDMNNTFINMFVVVNWKNSELRLKHVPIFTPGYQSSESYQQLGIHCNLIYVNLFRVMD